jgi:hypothetical protein
MDNGAWNAYLSGAPVFTSGFLWSSCCSIFSFLCRVLKYWYLQNSVVFLVIVLSVLLRFKAFVYPLGIFKLFCNGIAVTLFIYFYFESMKLYLMDYEEIDTSIFRGVRWNPSRKYLKKCGIILLNNTKYPTYISFQLSGIVD